MGRLSRSSASEKYELIRLVEESKLPIQRTLAEIGLPRSTFYRWYDAYQREGMAGLEDRSSQPRQFWNRIPETVRQQVVQIALQHAELSPRELAWHITDNEGYFISESSVYRILKSFDLITSPSFILVKAAPKYKQPTKKVNEMWQTDFSTFRIKGWGDYYLSTVLDDYSRYIIAWKLSPTMNHEDVEQTLNLAVAATGVKQIKVEHRPRLLSDNGSAYISQDFAEYMAKVEMKHIRGQVRHPQTQGKIERYHRSIKNVVCLDNYYFPWQLEAAIKNFVDYYNHQRYHEALNNVTPADVFFGRAAAIEDARAATKRKTFALRRSQHLLAQVAS
jgi:transposase InsO family protein